jgi:hypothetical protein
MTSTFEVLFGDDSDLHSADGSFYDALQSLEVEENADLPGAIQFTLPTTPKGAAGAEDLAVVGDREFRPYARVAVVVRIDRKPDACIFDGYVLAHSVHLEPSTLASTVQVWGQDASCLMNVVDKTIEREGSDVAIAEHIFGDYSFKAADANESGGGSNTADGRKIMQRGTDAQFLRERARRAGRLFRVACDQQPGTNTGYFFKPDLGADPATDLDLNPPDSANVESLEFSWDVSRPAVVMADALFESKDSVDGGADDSGFALLAQRSLATFAGEHATRTRLTAAAEDAGDLRNRSAAMLREAGWFVRCEGEAELARVGLVLRVGMIVQVNGAGRLHTGRYFVWSVRHTISAESHRMRFVLVRNAVGAA